MSTWISKALAIPAFMVGLAACDAPAGLYFGGTGGAAPLQEASLARGAVELRAPRGYCIDRASLRNRGFAMLARCDTLGATGAYAAFDLALITVTVAPASDAEPPLHDDLARSAGSVETLRTATVGKLNLVRLRSPEPQVPGLGRTFWRGAFVLNGQLVALGLYAAEDSGATGPAGARILGEIAERTRKASPQPTDEEPADSSEPVQTGDREPARNPLKALAALFD